MEVRIGVTQTPREIEIELADDTDRDQLVADVDKALASENTVLWITDKRGRRVGIPAAKIAYVELGSPHDERRVGFATH